MGALFLHLKPDEYLKKLYKTKKLVEKTSFSLQADGWHNASRFFILKGPILWQRMQFHPRPPALLQSPRFLSVREQHFP